MSREGYLAEIEGVKQGLAPADLNGGAETARIDMTKGERCTFIFDVASFAADLDITLKQHDAAAAGNSKVLATSNTYYTKVGAEVVWTKVEVSADASNFVLAQYNGAAGQLMVEVVSDDLDSNADYTHVSVIIADPAGIRLGSALAISRQMAHIPAYKQEL